MSSFKRSFLGAAVAMAVVSLCAHAAESESMFKHAPSISDSETPSIAKRQGNSITKRTSPSLGGVSRFLCPGWFSGGQPITAALRVIGG